MERRDFSHVNKQDLKVVIEMEMFRVQGTIEVLINHSPSDELNNAPDFIEVKSPQVLDRSTGHTKDLSKSLTINKNYIIAIFEP